MMERQIGDLERTVQILEPFVAGDLPVNDNLRRLALYYLGETYDLRGGDAAGSFLAIADGHDGRLADEALIALAHSKSRDGDNVGALELARRSDPDIRDGGLRHRLHELLGHTWTGLPRPTSGPAAIRSTGSTWPGGPGGRKQGIAAWTAPLHARRAG